MPKCSLEECRLTSTSHMIEIQKGYGRQALFEFRFRSAGKSRAEAFWAVKGKGRSKNQETLDYLL
jgi:hypothetical protein